MGVSDWTGAVCNWAAEWHHEQTADYFLSGDFAEAGYDLTIVEGFWLLPGKGALMQAGSTFPTVELIGIARHVCRRLGVPFLTVTPMNRSATRKRMVAYKKYERVSFGHGDHALDAEAVVVAGMKWSVTNLGRTE